MQAPARGRRYARFGSFEVDLQSGELRTNGRKIRLQEKPFLILAILLEQPGDLVSREEFRQRLWSADTFVDFEHSINVAVKKLREALGDDAENPRFIETLPRHGYRFIAPVETHQTLSPSSERGVESDSPPGSGGGQGVVGVGAIREPPPRKGWIVTGAAVIVALMAALFALNFGGLPGRLLTAVGARSAVPPPIESIAVLPLENLSGDKQQEYLADGLTDALITDLGKVASLRVISRTSVMRYKGTRKPLPKIARELDVDAVVEGTVQRSGDRVRITAQLLDARADRHLWAEIYDRDSGEIIRLEEQVALAIAHEVSGRLTPAQETRLASNRTTNPRAYDAYLHGRYLWNQRTEEPVAAAVGYFEQALREDPHFALAYSGLADCYAVGWWSKADFPLGEKYARKALALEPDLAEGHASLGIAEEYQLQFPAAEKELKRALELNPNYAMAHHFYAIHLLSLGRLGEALAENDRALQLDPFSLPINIVRGYILTGLRQYDRAVELCEATAAMNPQFHFPQGCRAGFYWIEGRVPEALAEERKAAALAHLPARLHELDEIAAAYDQSGPRAAKLKVAQQLEEKYHKGESLAFDVAFAYGVLGDKGKVVKWLNQSFRDRKDDLIFVLKSAPEFDCVRSDPRYQDLLRRANLPQ